MGLYIKNLEKVPIELLTLIIKLNKSYLILIILYSISLLLAGSLLLDPIKYYLNPLVYEVGDLSDLALALFMFWKLVASSTIILFQLPLLILLIKKKKWYQDKKYFRILAWIIVFIPVYLILLGMLVDCFIDESVHCLNFSDYIGIFRPVLPSPLKP